MHRTEVITVERRRRGSWADEQQIVEETLLPGASISAVARRYGLHPSQVFAWRKAAREENIEVAGCGGISYRIAYQHPVCVPDIRKTVSSALRTKVPVPPSSSPSALRC
jgi:hypothetical protein